MIKNKNCTQGIGILGTYYRIYGKIKPVVNKVEKILQLGWPQTKKQVRDIIGSTSFHRQYVPNFSELIDPLTKLPKKEPN